MVNCSNLIIPDHLLRTVERAKIHGTRAMAKWEFLCLQLVEIAILIGQFQSDRAF